ncbi:MAG: hypothetical protein WAV15_02685 [Minisyncoccia bacterium]
MEPEKKSNGALIGSIIIIIILIAGGIYVWQSKDNTIPEGTIEGTVVSPSDEQELDSLDQDLNSADTSIEANVINSVE